jgi:hypothetical protein
MSYKVIVNFSESNGARFRGGGDAIMCTCGMKKLQKEVTLQLLSVRLSLSPAPLFPSLSRLVDSSSKMILGVYRTWLPVDQRP